MALTDNLVSYWKMEDATDALGTYNGTATSVTFSSGNGKVNDGGGFNGTSSKIEISHNSALTPSALSCALWVKFSSLPTSGNVMALVDKRDNSGGTGGWGVQLYNNSGTYQIQFFGNTNTNTPASWNWTPTTGVWYHLVFTKPTGTTAATWYRDGSSQGTSGSQAFSSYTKSLYFGSRDGSGSYFAGALDEIGLWSREITSAEASQLYNSGTGTTYPFGTNYPITAAQGSYTLTGQATGLIQALKMLGAYATYAYTGFDTVFKLGKGFAADFGSYMVTGNDTLFSKVISMVASYGSYALTGFSATIQKGISIVVTTGSYVLTGFNARFPRFWTNIAKSVTSWINNTKNSTTWNNQDKSDI